MGRLTLGESCLFIFLCFSCFVCFSENHRAVWCQNFVCFPMCWPKYKSDNLTLLSTVLQWTPGAFTIKNKLPSMYTELFSHPISSSTFPNPLQMACYFLDIQNATISLSLLNYSSGPTPAWVLSEVKAGSYLYFYSIAKYNAWFKMRAQSKLNGWMNESVNQIIFGSHVKQSSKYILQDSLPSALDINQSFIFLCLSPHSTSPP